MVDQCIAHASGRGGRCFCVSCLRQRHFAAVQCTYTVAVKQGRSGSGIHAKTTFTLCKMAYYGKHTRTNHLQHVVPGCLCASYQPHVVYSHETRALAGCRRHVTCNHITAPSRLSFQVIRCVNPFLYFSIQRSATSSRTCKHRNRDIHRLCIQTSDASLQTDCGQLKRL